mmetsp:Transcript_30457/g.90950  ORF Transcript_30457/g.90950 Transcript_30457/m.90950 type:complete len:110 (+) Transcript_30457:331-660(+)
MNSAEHDNLYHQVLLQRNFCVVMKSGPFVGLSKYEHKKLGIQREVPVCQQQSCLQFSIRTTMDERYSVFGGIDTQLSKNCKKGNTFQGGFGDLVQSGSFISTSHSSVPW